MTPSDRLPPFLRRKLKGRDTVRRAFDNTFWLSCEQVVRLVAALLVGIWIARYLGPENYGALNYAFAIVGVVGAFTTLGIGPVVVRDLVRDPGNASRLLGSALLLRAVGAGVGFLACVGIASQQGSEAGTLTIIVAAGLVVQVPDVADLWFQARSLARVSSWVRMSACVLGSGVKGVLILIEAPLVALAVAGVAELAIAAIGWWWAASRQGEPIQSWRAEKAASVALMRDAWPLALSGLAIAIQAYWDQVVVGMLLGGGELGQYSAALRLVSVFAFVPMVIQTVAAPEIARAKRDDEMIYRRRLHNLYRLMFGLFVLTAVVLIVLGPSVTRLLFGDAYGQAAALIPLLAFRLFFTNFGLARSIYLTNEGLLRFGLLTSVVGAGVNLALNFVLVPHWGAKGAILASMISFGVTIFGLDVVQPKTRKNLGSVLWAILLPWRRFRA